MTEILSDFPPAFCASLSGAFGEGYVSRLLSVLFKEMLIRKRVQGTAGRHLCAVRGVLLCVCIVSVLESLMLDLSQTLTSRLVTRLDMALMLALTACAR